MGAQGFVPTAANYFGRIKKQQILETVAEAKGEETAGLLADLKKKDMAAEAERLIADTGWLPQPLRTAAFAGEEEGARLSASGLPRRGWRHAASGGVAGINPSIPNSAARASKRGPLCLEPFQGASRHAFARSRHTISFCLRPKPALPSAPSSCARPATPGYSGSLVQFYDTGFPVEQYGQYVSGYYVSTLLDGYGALCERGLCLDGGISAWGIDPDSMRSILDWLKTKSVERFARLRRGSARRSRDTACAALAAMRFEISQKIFQFECDGTMIRIPL